MAAQRAGIATGLKNIFIHNFFHISSALFTRLLHRLCTHIVCMQLRCAHLLIVRAHAALLPCRARQGVMPQKTYRQDARKPEGTRERPEGSIGEKQGECGEEPRPGRVSAHSPHPRRATKHCEVMQSAEGRLVCRWGVLRVRITNFFPPYCHAIATLLPRY